MNPTYQSWLEQRETERRTAQTYVSDAKRIERAYGNLDELYDRDKLEGVIQDLEYSKDDERRDRPNTSKIHVEARDGSPYKALASYRTAARTYRKFREESATIWDYFLGEAKELIEDGALDKGESYKEEHLGPAVSKSREALLANDNSWPELTKAAIIHPKNNLIDRRSYGSDKQSNQTKVVRWIEDHEAYVHTALMELWAEDDRSPGDRIRAFDARLPTDVFGQGERSPRLDVASYLLMGRDFSHFPPCRLGKFRAVCRLLQYPDPTAKDLGTVYENALRLLDDLLAEAAKRGMKRPTTRLDAQSVVWSLSDLPAPNETPDLTTVGDSPSPSTVAHPPVVETPLNTILYGPPGTGKTYATVRRCVQICDGQASEDVEELRARYGKLMDEGRIEFVTFHQSYGYEEFVEGIRPSDAETGLRLGVVPGVLRRIAERARKMPKMGARRIFKMSLGDPKSWGGTLHGDSIFAECIDAQRVLIEYGGDIDWSDSRYDDWNEIWQRWREEVNPDASAHDTDIQAMWRFRTEMRLGDIVVASDGYRHFRGVGEITGDYEFRRHDNGFHHRRAVRWHWHVRERQGDSVAVFKSGSFQWRPINLMKPSNPAGLNPYLSGIGEIGEARPHVLVIDEINRANVSKVMGELITLLEEDKREDAENEITVTLPYSGERFTLPKNLHILGTMNTADRSIALLDTALRRRFRFEEISPQPDLLNDAAERTNVNLPGVVAAMNKRLEYLVDRDHLIGHAWFMDARDRADVDGVMRHKIIPLIAEYFYDDWSKVRAVLGGTDDFVESVRLGAPPGLDDAMNEDRYSWTIQEEFAEEAYERLVAGRRSDDGE